MPETCLGCGCACDDIELRIDANRIVEARNACPLGLAWFGDGSAPSRALVHGLDVPVEEALTTAARMLTSASRPLVYLAPDVSCETQRAAIALADLLHAAIDSATSATARASVLAAQEAGRSSATLGEVRNRADVVVFWGVDPAPRYPRFTTRYLPEPSGTHVPNGRQSRTVIAVDVGSARGPEDADVRFTVMPEREVTTLTALTAAVSGQKAAADAAFTDALAGGKYVAIVADAERDEHDAGGNGRAGALIALAHTLNDRTRCALITLRAGGNRTGADAGLTSQTGYPMAVDFSRGYPRYLPHDDAVSRAARGGIDAALIVGAAASLPPSVAGHLTGLPAIAIGPRASEGSFAHVAASIDTGVVGIHEPGTALRMDDVPLPLQSVVAGPPRTTDVVRALLQRVTVARAGANQR